MKVCSASPPCYFITVSSDARSCRDVRRDEKRVKDSSSSNSAAATKDCKIRINDGNPDSSRYNNNGEESDVSDATSTITLIVLPNTIPAADDATVTDLPGQEPAGLGSSATHRDDLFHESFSTLSSDDSFLSIFDNVQDDSSSSFDQQHTYSEVTQPTSIDEETPRSSPLSFESLESWDDNYFTEGFVNVGQLLGAFH